MPHEPELRRLAFVLARLSERLAGISAALMAQADATAEIASQLADVCQAFISTTLRDHATERPASE